MALLLSFFKFFYNDLKVFIRKSINEGYRDGKLSITQRQGIIMCLPKGDKPKQFFKKMATHYFTKCHLQTCIW